MKSEIASLNAVWPYKRACEQDRLPRLYFEIVSIILRYVSFADSQPNVDGIGLSTECSSEKDNLSLMNNLASLQSVYSLRWRN
jgi:hypothetical protein